VILRPGCALDTILGLNDRLGSWKAPLPVWLRVPNVVQSAEGQASPSEVGSVIYYSTTKKVSAPRPVSLMPCLPYPATLPICPSSPDPWVSPNGASCTVPPEIDPILNATFGEQFGDSRVSDNLTWMQQSRTCPSPAPGVHHRPARIGSPLAVPASVTGSPGHSGRIQRRYGNPGLRPGMPGCRQSGCRHHSHRTPTCTGYIETPRCSGRGLYPVSRSLG
jgi:hypothetical protein